MDEHLGFIGLGKMGIPMAGRLLDAGFGLTVYDVRGNAVEALANKGVKSADSPAAVTAAAEIVLMSLPTRMWYARGSWSRARRSDEHNLRDLCDQVRPS
jgi:6-phosphogluconate dehydrogenase (decarboxylating)